MEPVTITLTSPIRDFGREVTQVAVLRECTGGDLLAIDGMGKMQASLKLVQLLCGTPEHCDKSGKPQQLSWEAVKSLSGRDIASISEAMAPFVGGDLPEAT